MESQEPSKLTIEDVKKVTSRLNCLFVASLEEKEKERLVEELNSMFGQWYEAD